jgi:hypothetical protein
LALGRVSNAVQGQGHPADIPPGPLSHLAATPRKAQDHSGSRSPGRRKIGRSGLEALCRFGTSHFIDRELLPRCLLRVTGVELGLFRLCRGYLRQPASMRVSGRSRRATAQSSAAPWLAARRLPDANQKDGRVGSALAYDHRALSWYCRMCMAEVRREIAAGRLRGLLART